MINVESLQHFIHLKIIQRVFWTEISTYEVQLHTPNPNDKKKNLLIAQFNYHDYKYIWLVINRQVHLNTHTHTQKIKKTIERDKFLN